MKRLVLLLSLLAALASAGQARAEALPCGLPAGQPLWAEYAGNAVDFRFTVFGRPGIVAGLSDVGGASTLRGMGAHTVYWHMQMKNLVGTPTAPADPATVGSAAQTVFDRAVLVSGCATPVVVLNELWGSYKATPWLYENAIYRQNVLSLVKALAERGAVPMLLVPGPSTGYRSPFVAGDAATWWLEVARYAHVVREMHFNAPYIYGKGPVVGPRTRRIAMRQALAPLLGLGIPADRLGLLLGFQSGAGKGGREGLGPRGAWLEIVKQDALAARQVAGELGLGSIWSWGWATFTPNGADPDKPAAACVYLWVRDPYLCDGPGAGGGAFNTSLTLGQILLAPGVQCTTRIGDILTADADRITGVLGSRRNALTALLARLVYRTENVPVTEADVARAEQGVIERSFAGDAAAYSAALTQLGLDDVSGREIIGDQLLRQSYEAVVQVRYVAPAPDAFTERAERDVLRTAVCAADELPSPGIVDWTAHVSALRVPASSVSIQASRYSVSRGTSIVLRGNVASERSGEQITVYARGAKASSFAVLASAAVGADGGWTVRVAPRGATYYRAVCRSAASPAILVRVKPRR